MKLFRTFLIILIILSSFTLFSQEQKPSKNCVYFDVNYLRHYLKSDPHYNWHTYIFMLNYYRTLLDTKVFELKLKSGLGFYTESPGETDGLFPSLNLNLGTIGFLGNKKHKGYSGLFLSTTFYGNSKIHLYFPLGYEFCLNSKFAINISYNQNILTISSGKENNLDENYQKTQWIWDSYTNEYLLNIGIGYHF